MKRFILTVAFALGTLTGIASHLLGGQLTAVCADDTNTTSVLEYNVTLLLLRDVQGIPLQNSQVIDIGGSGPAVTATLPKVGSFTVTLGNFGVEFVFYQGVVDLLPGTNNIISWTDCCRPGNIVNIQNSGSYSMYYYTTVNTGNGCNSSPLFLAPPALLWPYNVPWASSLAAYDIDGDVLTYSLDMPYEAPNTPVSGYSPPSSATGGAPTVDALTGIFTYTASAVGANAVAYEVSAFDGSGQLTGLLRRETLLMVVNPPGSNLISVTPPASTVPGQYSFMVGAPDTVVFNSSGDTTISAQYFVPSYVDSNSIYFDVDAYKQGKNADVSFSWNPAPGQEGQEFPVVVRFETQGFSWDESFMVNAIENDISINEREQANMYVYPNPAEGQFTITLDRPVDMIQIIDPSGRVIRSEKVESTIPFRTMDTPTVSGVYFIQIHDLDGHVFTRSLIVK